MLHVGIVVLLVRHMIFQQLYFLCRLVQVFKKAHFRGAHQKTTAGHAIGARILFAVYLLQFRHAQRITDR